MKLILEAIKALFRKVENKIPKTLNDLLHGEKIPGNVVEDMYNTIPGKYNHVFAEQTLKMSELTDDYSFVRSDGVATYGRDIPGFNPADVGITEDSFGKVYAVIWDGVEYECTVEEHGFEYAVLGNPNIAHSGKDDTGEPFCILMDVYWGNEIKLHIRTNEPGEHTVAIGTIVKSAVVTKMPKHYLPDHDHGVTPIEMGGTGATSKEDAIKNLGLMAYKAKGFSSAQANETARGMTVGTNFTSADNSIVILVWGGTNTTMDCDVNRVQFNGVTIPIDVTNGNFYPRVSIGERFWFMFYYNGYLYPLNIEKKIE